MLFTFPYFDTTYLGEYSSTAVSLNSTPYPIDCQCQFYDQITIGCIPLSSPHWERSWILMIFIINIQGFGNNPPKCLYFQSCTISNYPPNSHQRGFSKIPMQLYHLTAANLPLEHQSFCAKSRSLVWQLRFHIVWLSPTSLVSPTETSPPSSSIYQTFPKGIICSKTSAIFHVSVHQCCFAPQNWLASSP